MDKNVKHTLLISSLSLGIYVVLICHDLTKLNKELISTTWPLINMLWKLILNSPQFNKYSSTGHILSIKTREQISKTWAQINTLKEKLMHVMCRTPYILNKDKTTA